MNNLALAASPVDELTAVAFEDLCLTLQAFNNQLNKPHRDALRDILNTYSRFAYGDGLRPGTRFAFPLATAMGKTQSIVSWALAVHNLDLPFTLLVCQEQIRDLDELRGDLIAKGVPADKVGLFHRDASQATISEGSPADYQFVLITHSMIRTTKEADLYMNTDENEPRSVCVYDESLIKSVGRTVSGSSLEAAAKVIETVLHSDFTDRDKITSTQFELLGYLESSLQVVISRFKSGDDEAFELHETLSSIRLQQFEHALAELPSPVDRRVRAIISNFLSMANEPLRVAKMGQGNKDGIISYELRIPPSLRNVVILDASAAVRELQVADKDIQVIDRWENIKQFTKLRVDQYRVQSGAGFQRDKMAVSSTLLKDVSDDITGGWLPADAAVVFCLSKGANNLPRNRKSPEEKLKARLQRDGVDLDAKVRIWTGPDRTRGLPAREVIHPKYEFITYGQEKSTNRFRHCSHIIAIGVARRDLVDLAGNLAGQLEDLSSDEVTNHSRVSQMQASEQFYRLQQLIGRGTTRQTVDGEAGDAWVKVYDHGNFEPFIQRALPGCTWQVHERATHAQNVHHKQRQGRKSAVRVTAEQAGVRFLESRADKVMVSEVTALPELQSLTRRARQRILKSIGEMTGRGRAGNGRGSFYVPVFETEVV